MVGLLFRISRKEGSYSIPGTQKRQEVQRKLKREHRLAKQLVNAALKLTVTSP